MKCCNIQPKCLFLGVMVVLLQGVRGSERPMNRGFFFGRRRLSSSSAIRRPNRHQQQYAVELTSSTSQKMVVEQDDSFLESSSPPVGSALSSLWTSPTLVESSAALWRPLLPDDEHHKNAMHKASIDVFVTAPFLSRKPKQPAFTRTPRNPKTQKKSSSSKRRVPLPVTTAEGLRQQVLDQGQALKQVRVHVTAQNFTHQALLDHQVVQLLVQRGRERSKPGHRPANDTARLALAIEGGGMRGAVSAGMAAALMCLGLSDGIDTIYGSSAGSVIGAYMVSRQLCMDVYVDILPAAKGNFVCLKRLWKSICLDMLHSTLAQRQGTSSRSITNRSNARNKRLAPPGLNTSFILDEIMHPQRGVRPLDLPAFLKNDQDQPLRIAATYAENGRVVPHCFGGRDFQTATSQHNRNGVYACLQASMHVPGAAGAPVVITDEQNHTRSFYDAFCGEPLPYRSAVAQGATHCLVLCSRPDGYQPKTKQTLFESGVAPAYFSVHGEKELARFFKKGGQQYIYAEDLLTLMEGQQDRGDGVLVPPPQILYGVEKLDEQAQYLVQHRQQWRKAHLLPIKVPLGTSELPTLENKRESVLESVRAGFAVVYDIFAPALGLKVDNLTGAQVAKIVFPDSELCAASKLATTACRDEKLSGSPMSPWKQVAVKSARLFKILGDVERDGAKRVRKASEEYLRQVRKVLDSFPGMECESFKSFLDSVRKSHDLV